MCNNNCFPCGNNNGCGFDCWWIVIILILIWVCCCGGNFCSIFGGNNCNGNNGCGCDC